jgi:hypothetical protein
MVSRLVVSRHGVARWVARIAASAALVWVAVLAVQLMHQAAQLELSVPLPDVPTAAFMIAFYGCVRMFALRVASRGL